MIQNSTKDYNNGKIYCIRNNITDDIYVGSTTQPLSKRMAKHRQDSRREIKMHRPFYLKVNELGIDNFYIELIENYPCESLEQLRKREGHYIRKMGTLNQQIAGRTCKELLEQNKEKVKEYFKEYSKEYREKQRNIKEWVEQNKEKVKQYDKEYREQNKDKIK